MVVVVYLERGRGGSFCLDFIGGLGHRQSSARNEGLINEIRKDAFALVDASEPKYFWILKVTCMCLEIVVYKCRRENVTTY